MTRVVVVGGGLGGLCAAALLARRGYAVTLLERTGATGGKMGRWASGGYTFDTGPTLLTMPFVIRELFEALGVPSDEVPLLEPVHPVCRYFYRDGSVFSAFTDPLRLDAEVAAFHPPDVQGVRSFLEHGERIYHAAAAPFLFSPFGSWNAASILDGLRQSPALFRIDAFRTLDASVRGFVSDRRLRQMFNRFATYNGSSPYRAPATLAIIPYIEFRMGGWYIRGGLYRLAEALEQRAVALGVTIRMQTDVRRIVVERGRARGVMTAAGERVEADLVVCNADAVYATRHLLDGEPAAGPGPEPSLAGFILMLGVARTYPHLAHHNIFFSRDYREEFASLERGILPDDPTIYVSVSSAVDPAMAPHGHSAMFVLVNAPPLPPGGETSDDTGRWERYRDRVLVMLEERGLADLRRHVVIERMVTPGDAVRRFNAHRGSIYGLSSNSRMTAFLRPPNRSRRVRGLYFAGGSTHPGGGVPLVLLSGRMVADLIERDGAGR